MANMETVEVRISTKRSRFEKTVKQLKREGCRYQPNSKTWLMPADRWHLYEKDEDIQRVDATPTR